MNRKHILAVLAVSAGLLLLVQVSVAAAGKPDRQPNVLPPPFTQAMCGPAIGDVTVSIDPDTFRAYLMTFQQRDGTTKVEFTGYAEQIVQGNGKTLAFNVSGPGALYIRPDGSIYLVAEGHLFYIGPLGTPQPGLKLYTGEAVLSVDPATGIAVVSSFSGHVTDVCALLAA